MGWLSKLKQVFPGPADEFPGTAADECGERPWWEKDAADYRERKRRAAYDEIVDDRAFLLGLDELYRAAMKKHECGELLACAQHVAVVLKAQPADVPIEGYYTEHPDLVTYFRLMRTLQAEPVERSSEVESLPQFQRLLEVTSSPIFGIPIRDVFLLPRGRDPLSAALREAASQTHAWTVPSLMTAASILARQSDDYSLVGLACRAEDSVAVTALRESVVLYAEIALGAAAPPRYVWRVDPELAAAGQRFIDGFNELFGKELPPATKEYAYLYGGKAAHARIEGRCVRLGQTTDVPPAYYHWAVARADGEFIVDEFWAADIWTTDRYRGNRAGVSRG